LSCKQLNGIWLFAGTHMAENWKLLYIHCEHHGGSA